MVRNMTEKKDPHQKIDPADLSDDDDIIELTEEVILDPKKDDGILELKDDITAAAQRSAGITEKTDKKESEADDEDNVLERG